MSNQDAPLPQSGEDDKRRIAREIHDDFGQRAAALAIFLTALGQKLPAADPLAKELRHLGQNATELGEDLRRFSHELHPSRLERRGLLAALREQATQVASRSGLELELHLPESLDNLPFEAALAVFRVAQESLANIVSHAGARKIRLELRQGQGIVLLIEDDGRGFDLTEGQRRGGLGLTGIAERAALFGGTSRVDTTPGGGTRLTFTLPPPEEPGLWGRFRRLIHRHRGEVIAAALVFLALTGGIFATLRQAERARAATLRADATIRFLEKIFEGANPRRHPGGVPDAVTLLRRGSEILAKDTALPPLQRAKLLDTLGGIEIELGLYDEARAHLEESLQLRSKEHDDNPLDLATTFTRLGRVALFSGREGAIGHYQRALDLLKKHSEGSQEDLIAAYNNLGTAMAVSGDLDGGTQFLLESLALAEKSWPPNDPRLAKALHNLAGIAFERYDSVAFERYLLRALEIREKSLTANDPDLLESQEALAALRLDQKRPAEAVELLERILPIIEKTFGPDHPNCARILLSLALGNIELGHLDEARSRLARARSIAEAKLAPDHRILQKIERMEQRISLPASP